VTFPVLFVCICVLNNCHRVATQLQLNISYHMICEARKPFSSYGHVMLQHVNLCMSYSELEFRFRIDTVLSVVDVSSLSV
jgi:hypothetical protein